MKKWISRHNALAAVSTVTAAAMLTACGGAASSSAASSAASQADSAASSSEASSAAESWGDVKLTMWGAEEDQTMLREMADAFIAENADKGNVTIEIGASPSPAPKIPFWLTPRQLPMFSPLRMTSSTSWWQPVPCRKSC